MYANSSAKISTEIVSVSAVDEYGYVTVVFKLSQTEDQSVSSIRIDYEETLYNTQAVMLCISDVAFSSTIE